MTDNQVAILGGGVIGVTTALTLELQGYDTCIYTKHRPYHDGPKSQPHGLASNYAAASVKPATIEGDVSDILEDSQQLFSALYDAGTEGIVQHYHYVVKEEPVDDPEYKEQVENFQRLQSLSSSEYDTVPRLTEAVYGWRFNAYFAEMPYYIPRIYNLYQATGGKVIHQEVGIDDLETLDEEIAVNCTGYWSRRLFNDDSLEARRGHLVFANTPAPVRHPEIGKFSYSYNASKSVGEGLQGNVYAYPRVDRLVLGGSSHKGFPDPEKEWTGESIDSDTVDIGGVEVPKRVQTVNREILNKYVDIDVNDFTMEADYGYRPYRHGGVRIELENGYGTPVVHNYGHGGAGVTLSWGSALEASERVRKHIKPRNESLDDVGQSYAVLEHLEEIV